EAVLGLLECDLQVPGRIGSPAAGLSDAPVHVHPLKVHRIDGVLLTLKPVARQFRKEDLHESVLPAEWLPIRKLRRGRRAEVCPQEPGMRAARIGPCDRPAAAARARIDDILERLLEAPAIGVEPPAMVIAPQPARLHVAVRQIRATMGTMALEQPEVSREVAVE